MWFFAFVASRGESRFTRTLTPQRVTLIQWPHFCPSSGPHVSRYHLPSRQPKESSCQFAHEHTQGDLGTGVGSRGSVHETLSLVLFECSVTCMCYTLKQNWKKPPSLAALSLISAEELLGNSHLLFCFGHLKTWTSQTTPPPTLHRQRRWENSHQQLEMLFYISSLEQKLFCKIPGALRMGTVSWLWLKFFYGERSTETQGERWLETLWGNTPGQGWTLAVGELWDNSYHVGKEQMQVDFFFNATLICFIS